MKRITTGDLAAAIRQYRPIVTDDMVRVWAERGLIPADRNPGSERGWWYVLPGGLAEAMLANLGMMTDEVAGVIRYLGLAGAGKQLGFFEKKSESQDVNLSVCQNVGASPAPQGSLFPMEQDQDPQFTKFAQ
jgi:hypothetical protein